MSEIQFTASVYKVQTLVDGGIRVTLDLPETAIIQMAALAECQVNGIALEVCVKHRSNRLDAALETRTKRKSTWATAKQTDADEGA